MRTATQIRNIDGTWEVTDKDGRKCFYAGVYAITNIYSHYSNAGKLMDEARRNPMPFDCAELAPLFRRVIQFRDGSWHRLMDDGTWAAKSCAGAVRGCLVYRSLNVRAKHLKLMLAYLKEHAA